MWLIINGLLDVWIILLLISGAFVPSVYCIVLVGKGVKILNFVFMYFFVFRLLKDTTCTQI